MQAFRQPSALPSQGSLLLPLATWTPPLVGLEQSQWFTLWFQSWLTLASLPSPPLLPIPQFLLQFLLVYSQWAEQQLPQETLAYLPLASPSPLPPPLQPKPSSPPSQLPWFQLFLLWSLSSPHWQRLRLLTPLESLWASPKQASPKRSPSSLPPQPPPCSLRSLAPPRCLRLSPPSLPSPLLSSQEGVGWLCVEPPLFYPMDWGVQCGESSLF